VPSDRVLRRFDVRYDDVLPVRPISPVVGR